MKILVAYRGLPWPITEGYHLRVLHLFRRLAQRHEVHLLGLVHTQEQREQLAPLEADGFLKSITVRDVPGRNWLGRLRTNMGLEAVSAFDAEYPSFKEQLRIEVREMKARLGLDVAYVFDPWADLWFRDAAKEIPTLLDVCDCRTFYYERRLENGIDSTLERFRTRQFLKRFKAYEKCALASYPAATVVSPLDKDALLRLNPSAKVEVIPNGVDLEMFRPQENVKEMPGNLILFGNMDFLPNYDAAIHFARDILPLVRERHPDATFTIVGTNPLPEVTALADEIKGVEVTGRVDDLSPWIQRSSMLVAPMRYGAGIKNKVLETMAVERPVVTNSMGTEAMHPDVRALLKLADEPQDFADEVCKLLDNPEQRLQLGRQGREVMARVQSWDAAASAYEALFESLKETPA